MSSRHLIAVALSACAGLSQAGVVTASDNFDGYNSGTIAGANGGSGWGGAWTGSSASSVSTVGGSDSPMSGQALRFSGNDERAATRQLAQTVTGSVFVDFLFQFDSGAIDGNDFLGLYFGSATGPNIGLKANCDSGCTADLFVRTTGTSGQYSTPIQVGETLRLVGLLEKLGHSNTYNSYSLWVNPTAAELADFSGADAVFRAESNLSAFSTIGFRSANLDANDIVFIDDLRIGVIPEPGTLALAGAALLGMGAAARRRRG